MLVWFSPFWQFCVDFNKRRSMKCFGLICRMLRFRPSHSCVNSRSIFPILKAHCHQVPAVYQPLSAPVADPGGLGPPCHQDFFKIMQFSGNFKGKTPILSKFWAQGPPWGQNSTGPAWPKSWIRAWALTLGPCKELWEGREIQKSGSSLDSCTYLDFQKVNLLKCFSQKYSCSSNKNAASANTGFATFMVAL